MTHSAFAGNVLLFGRVLRSAGLDVHHGRLVDAITAVEMVGVRDRADVRAALRGLLVHRRDDLDRFDQAFDLFFRARREPGAGTPLFPFGHPPRITARTGPGSAIQAAFEDVRAESAAAGSRAIAAWSHADVSRTKDFGEFTDAELERACAVLEQLPWQLSIRRTRRWEIASGGAIDLRPFIRRNLMRGGDFVDLPRRERTDTARPIVLIADVSGSMDRYSRALLHFVYGLAHSGARVETFVFATRLTRLTPSLARRRGGAALDRLVRSVQDWGSGTRIGDALRSFNTTWARRVMRNGPVVLLISDGWDRGEPSVLSRELARVRRSCRRLIWLNPLLGSATYEPLTRGMLAALRHVDDFLPVHNIDSVEQLGAHLRTLNARSRPVAWQHSR